MIKLAILTTHPIQYQVPWFRALAQIPDVDLTVFFCMIPDERQQGDGFGISFKWDIPLLEGYSYKVLENISKAPSATTFFGCDTPGIAAIVKSGEFDAFIVNGWVAKSCLQLLAACRRYRVPCIVRGESNALRPRAWWKKIIHRQLLSRYAAFLNIGNANRDFYLQNGVTSEKIFFAPYCIENNRFITAAKDLHPQREALRTAWGISAGAYTFLFCAKFIDKKRPLDVLQALKRLGDEGRGTQDENRSVHLLMVGSGELLEQCKVFAGKHGLPVTFAGFLNQSEIPRAYVAADCLVLPSDDGETWGLVTNEAMACGLPAIVSDQVGCHPDLISAGVTGEVFPFGNVEAFAEKMRGMLADPDRSRRMGCAARARVAGYCYEEVVRGTLDALAYIQQGNGKK